MVFDNLDQHLPLDELIYKQFKRDEGKGSNFNLTYPSVF
jgi:hypothetical protein